MPTPSMPELYKLKTRAKYIAADVDNNVVAPNNVSVVNDTSIYGDLNVQSVSTFHDTVHVDNSSSLNITTPQVNLSAPEVNVTTSNVNLNTDVSVNTQKVNLVAHDDISIVSHKVSLVGSDDVTISIPNKKLHVTGEVDITGDLVIDTGDIVLNGMSVGDMVSSTFRPIHQQIRMLNPFSPLIYSDEVAMAESPYPSYLQGWHYSETTKANFNSAYNSNKTKMNWYLPPGTSSTKMKDFKGLNIETTFYNAGVPFISIYTKPNTAPGQHNTRSWYQSKINFIFEGVLPPIDNTTTPPGLRASLVYGDYSNTQTLGTTKFELKYDPDFSLVSNDTLISSSPRTLAEALEAVKDQEIFRYSIQTDSSTSNFSFTVHDLTFTETTTVGNKTFETSFINMCQSLLG